MDNKFILKEVIHTLFKHIFSPRSHGTTGTWLLANEKGARCILLVIAWVLIFTKNSIQTSF